MTSLPPSPSFLRAESPEKSMHLITCKKTCCTTTRCSRLSRRRPPTCAPISLLHSLYCSSPNYCLLVVRQAEDLASSPLTTKERRRAERSGEERRGGSDMDQRQTNWQVIQLTRASLTEDDARRRTSEGEAGSKPATKTRGTGTSVTRPPVSLTSGARSY